MSLLLCNFDLNMISDFKFDCTNLVGINMSDNVK